jgi:hypothetical protein
MTTAATGQVPLAGFAPVRTPTSIAAIEPERPENQQAIAEMNPGMESRQTLKLLAVLDIQRRNGLLSSKRSK